MGPSGLDSGSNIQRVQDNGWTRLRRGSVKRTGPASCLSFGGISLIVIVGFFVLAALQIHPFVSFVLLCVVLVLAGIAVSAIAELLWGTGARVSVSRKPVRAGETFKVRCAIGRPRNAEGLKVLWQGREEAVLRAYDTVRYAEPFHRQELSDVLNMSATIEIPADAMPSFSAKNVRIVWSIVVETRTGGGGLAQNDFPMLVLPARS
jgi:hypothetical protein